MTHLKREFTRLLLALTIGSARMVAAGEHPEGQASNCLLDYQGRQLIPGGYVALENIPYTADDYRRMVRMTTGNACSSSSG